MVLREDAGGVRRPHNAGSFEGLLSDEREAVNGSCFVAEVGVGEPTTVSRLFFPPHSPGGTERTFWDMLSICNDMSDMW